MENRHDPCQKPGNKNDCVNLLENTADLNVEPYRDSFQRLLNNNLGSFVTIDLMINTCEIRAISGIIEQVTGRYVILKNPKNNCRVVGDAWSIKTVTFPCCEC